MSSHYATADVWIENLDNESEAGDVSDVIEQALRRAGYHCTVDVTTHPNTPLPGEGR